MEMLTHMNGTGCPPIERKCRYRGLLVLAVLVFLCCVWVMPAAAADADAYHEVENVDELRNVIDWSNADANKSIPFLVAVNSDIEFDGGAWLPEIRGNITLTTSSSANNKIHRTAANTTGDTGMFTIGSGGNLTIIDNGTHPLTLDGNNTVDAIDKGNGQSLVRVNSGGNFTLAGGILMNNTVIHEDISAYGGGGYVEEGTFTMTGGSIENCKATSNSGDAYGGGVEVYEVWVSGSAT